MGRVKKTTNTEGDETVDFGYYYREVKNSWKKNYWNLVAWLGGNRLTVDNMTIEDFYEALAALKLYHEENTPKG